MLAHSLSHRGVAYERPSIYRLLLDVHRRVGNRDMRLLKPPQGFSMTRSGGEENSGCVGPRLIGTRDLRCPDTHWTWEEEVGYRDKQLTNSFWPHFAGVEFTFYLVRV